MIPYLFVILFHLEVTGSFNIDTKSPFIYLNPIIEPKSSLFGYSVQLYPEKGSTNAGIFIGAPEGRYTQTPENSTGVLFQCPIQQHCKEIFIEQVFHRDMEVNSTKKTVWLGGSIDIDYDFDKLVACAHRTFTIAPNAHKTYGDCYWFHIANGNTTQIKKLQHPTVPDIYSSIIGKYNIMNFYSAQAGFSVHFVHQRKSALILGAPGVLSWYGNTILYKSDGKNEFNKNGTLTNIPWNQPDNYYRSDNNIFGLLGYSVSSGKFYDKNILYYVSGGPKANLYSGYIIIYNYIPKTKAKARVKEIKTGSQFGEYFGSSLTVGDINNDGYDDLIVGSPFYTNTTFNEGRVHVYLGNQSQLVQPRFGYTISGLATNGQFGATVQFLGDLNKDGFGDVAIAAPYELDNSGVVYIYEGNQFGLNPEFSQRIVGREVYSEIRGFGISISNAVDIDKNKYLDVAVGAHLSEHVVVFQTSPVVQVFHTLELNANETHIKRDAKDFQINVCFSAKSTESEPINITMHMLIDEELERTQLKDGKFIKLITLKPGRSTLKTCEVRTITLKDTSNFYIPIKISLWHTFEPTSLNNSKVLLVQSNKNIEMPNFCVRCPVYDKKRSSKLVLKEIPFFLGCGSNNICTSYLEIVQQMHNINNGKIILGWSNSVTLNITVNNSKEIAYQTYILLTKPDIIIIKQLPEICEETNLTTIKCTFNKPITANQNETISLEFDLSNINKPQYSAGNTLHFETTIFTSSENSNPNRTKILKVGVITEADIKITGKSGQDTYSYGKITNGKPSFLQNFQIEKFGPSPITLVEIDITIPHSIQAKYDNNKVIQFIEMQQPIGKLDEGQFNCRSDSLFLSTYIPYEMMYNNTDELSEEITIKRNKRQTIKPIQTSLKNEKFKESNTLTIGCNDDNIICTKIECTAGPFISQQNIGFIQIRMRANINLITEHFGKNYNNIIITSNASIRILNPANLTQSGEEPDFVQVSSHFVGDKEQQKVLFIILISVVSGVLLLLLIILGLVKAGFFRRSTKNKLNELKKEIENEENDNKIDQGEEIIQFEIQEEEQIQSKETLKEI